MRHVLLATLALALAGVSSGCKLGQHLGAGNQGLHRDAACRDGACHQNSPCACGGQGCEQCRDGHGNPNEPFYHGNLGQPQRGGLFSSLHGGAGGPGGAGGAGGGMQMPPPNAQPAPGPSAGNVSYPYYTTRGPRDFLSANPRGIGP